jgi:maleate isomerase
MSADTTLSPLQQFEVLPEEMTGKVANGVGLVAPFDFALDGECQRWLPTDVPMYVTRTPELEETEVTVTLAKEVGSELAVTPAVRSLLAVRPAAIGYACTSGSFVNGQAGEKHLQDVMMKAGAPAAVTTSGALILALQALGVRSVAIATPYNHDLTQLLTEYLDECGYQVPAGAYLNMERDIARVNPDAVVRMARAIDRPDAEALFFSCTNLHTFDIIEPLERELGKPVLSANMVTMWASLKAGGLAMPSINHRLFTL